MGKVGIGDAIGASVRFIGEGWTRAWGIMLLSVAITAAFEVMELMEPDWTLIPLLSLCVMMFVGTAATGALFRLRFEGDHPGDADFTAHPAGLQWGGLEWRVLGANWLAGLIIGVLAFVLTFIWAIALGAALQGDPADLQAFEGAADSDKVAALGHLMLGPGGVVSAIILVPAAVGLFYLGCRLLVFTPFVIDTRSFDLGKAWGIARGAMLALVVSVIAIFVADFIVGAVGGFLLGAVAGLLGHASQAKAWGGAAGQVLSAAINPPLFAGLALYVYRAQRADPGVVATFS